MKTRRAWWLAGLLVCALALAVFLCWPWIRARPARNPVRRSAAARRAPAFRVEFDLVTSPSDTPLQLTVPARKRFALKLVNRAPGVTYFWKLSVPQLPSNYGTIPPSLDHKRPPPGAWDCPSLETPLRELLETTREQEVEKRLEDLVRALAQAPQSGRCPVLAVTIKGRLELLRFGDIGIESTLPPGTRGTILIEKREPSTDAVLRTWAASIEAEGREEGWAFDHEQAWIVAETVRDIAAMALADKGQPPQELGVRCAGGPAQYRVTVDAGGRRLLEQYELNLQEHVWSPLTYVAVAKTLLEGRPGIEQPRSSPPAQAATPAVANLLDLGVPVLLDENRRLSRLLAESPLDPDVQEQAALLLGAFALRDAAGAYSDTRRELSGMAAHLALAEVARSGGGPSTAGVLAAIVLETLAGREMPARKKLAGIPAASVAAQDRASFEAWGRALMLRITSDWRSLKQPERATAIEKYEYLRATVRGRGDLEGLDALEKIEPTPDAQWLRPLVESRSSVQTVNFARELLLRAELSEAATVLGFRADQGAAEKSAAESIAAAEGLPRFEPSRPLEILNRGTWARQVERHIANAVGFLDYGLASMLGLDEAAMEFRKSVRELLALRSVAGSLEQTAYDRWTQAGASSTAPQRVTWKAGEACRQFAQEVRTRPERVPAAVWDTLSHGACIGAVHSGQVAPWGGWFSPALPSGTAYEVDQRFGVPDVAARYSLEEIERLHALVFYEHRLFYTYVQRRYGREPQGVDYARDLGQIAEYDLGALASWADAVRTDGDEYLRLTRRLCEASPDWCFVAGDGLAARGSDDAARRAYERGVEHARDRVGMANGAEWLAHHYLDRGETERALALGQMMADVYSAAGLAAMGHVEERLGDYVNALAYYQAIQERYHNSSELHSFFIRYQVRHGGGKYRAETDRALEAMFPLGLKRATLAALTAESQASDDAGRSPRHISGALVDTITDETFRRLGLREGDRIVALDGYRVRDWDQYRCVRSLSDDPRTTVIVWRDGRYVQLAGTLKRRSFAPVRAGLRRVPVERRDSPA